MSAASDACSKQDYAVGSAFSSADIILYHLFSWAGLHGIGFVEHIDSYLKRQKMRPAFTSSMTVAGWPAVGG